MKNIINLNDRITIEEEASLWIAKVDRKLTAPEEQLFKEWLTANAAHYKIFMAMAEQWDRTEVLKNLTKDGMPTPKPIRKTRFYQPAVAACILLLCMLGIGGTFQYLLPQLDDREVIHFSDAFSTTNSNSSDIDLPDGSRLKINAKSLVSVTYTKTVRKIELHRGEIFVEVAHDIHRPLVVVANGHFVRAVGTAFNVDAMDARTTKVTVTEGKVIYGATDDEGKIDMSIGKSNVVLTGQQATLGDSTDKVIQLSKEDVERTLSWRSGKLIFNGETLKEVLVEIERYTDYRFVASSAIENTQVIGYFKAGDIDKFLAAMQENFDIGHKIENNQITLFKINP